MLSGQNAIKEDTVTHVFCSRSASEQRANSCPRHAGRLLQKSAVSPSASGAGQIHCPTPSVSCLSPLTKKQDTHKAHRHIDFSCLLMQHCALEWNIFWEKGKWYVWLLLLVIWTLKVRLKKVNWHQGICACLLEFSSHLEELLGKPATKARNRFVS